MALFRDLIRTIADAEGISEMTVTGVGQYLRDAGLISKHGRGRAAAKMTIEDAAHLIIGVNASALAKDAPRVVNAFAQLTEVDEQYPILDEGDALSRALHRPKNAAACLAALIGLYAETDENRSVIDGYDLILTFRQPDLSLKIWVGWLSDNDEEADEPLCILRFTSSHATSVGGDRTDQTTITEVTLAAIGRTLRS